MEGTHPKTGTPHKRVGSVVRGKYCVEAFLATGTMANVYAATHRNGAKVALKILHQQLKDDPALCQRFKREGYFANSIGHPGVVRAIDDDVTEDGCPFLVMELLEGETLDERRRRKGGKLALSWLLPVADSLLEILAAAHSREVVHRDLKPDNIFVTKTGEVKVLDFGVARWADGKESSDMTAVGMVLGTPAYMPPEQALGRREEVDAQSDIWAVGATLFVVLSGESVHEGGDAKAKLIATARTAARPLREAAPDVPRGVAAVVDRALAFHKQERWPDAEAMREALRWARLSLDEQPGETVSHAASDPLLEPVPPPVPTRRTLDSEPTIARAAPQSMPPGAVPSDPNPRSHDFLTSAPPITLRDAPTAAPASAGPVFSLRREKRGEPMPETERVPVGLLAPDHGAPVVPAADDGAARHAQAMASYDPAAVLDDLPASSRGAARAPELNFSFTRPMAAMVMPKDYQAPRPAAGVPMFPADDAAPMFPPPASPAPHLASASPMAHGTGPPPPMMAGSTRPPGFQLMPTEPSLRAQALGSSPSPGVIGAPGPLLSELVEPSRGRAARIVVPLALALLALVAVAIVVRSRARGDDGDRATASAAPTVTTTATATAASGAAPTAAASAAATAVTAAAGAASLAAPQAVPAPEPTAPEAVAKTVKRPKRPKKRRTPKPPGTDPSAAASPASPSDSAGEATPATPPADVTPPIPTPTPADVAPPTPATAAPPADPTPLDSLPAKDPEPAPAGAEP